ncbi:MlaE family ABC transporter permease [Quisquiliibacterium transsilvanicum]|uniref:Phospholipid/cholesterol/gamma-HCH transport system permease protein n=1 Tax=Quisquiliibacterium transsilvanicum TaxID=1549638 RepID=A0A7W8M9E3_9BURK|nr:ABC transporter permease [Quisquiliibacterium transsilvanicum]MBB5272951.1 phospholipid/cholesterol/gamma-HCH transport system permease protein [Quisquiliibacterium transsilvanicum]
MASPQTTPAPAEPPPPAPWQPEASVRERAEAWWQALRFAALTLATALSPDAYDREMRRATARQVVLSAWPALPGFLAACAVLSLVLVRIVVDTAQSYGLSQYALELAVRVLVIEVIPLLAALSVALRSGAAMSTHVALKHVRGDFEAMRARGQDPVRHAFAPRAFGSVVAVMLLAWLSSAIAMLIAYLVMYGLSPWALDPYLRIIGQVFAPVVVTGLALKTLFFGLAVAAIPVSAALSIPRNLRLVPAAIRDGMARLGVALVAIEVGSLAVMYA